MNHLYKLFLSLIYVREEASFDTLELKANSRNVQKGSILGPLIFYTSFLVAFSSFPLIHIVSYVDNSTP